LVIDKLPLKKPGVVIARFALTGAGLGLVAGFFEAAILSSAERFHSLWHLFVAPVIWFLAPLVDLVLWGLFGLLIGLAVAFSKRVESWLIATLMALQVSLAATHVVEVVDVLRINRMGHHHVAALVCALLFFAVLLVVLRIGWRRAGRYFDARRDVPPTRLAGVVLAAALTLVLGLGFSLAPRLSLGNPTQASARSSTSAPNIILITLDTVRADHLSAYGYRRPTTANLDRLARQGVLFENAISATSWTLGSHASMFTGLLPHQHGANWLVPLNSNSVTLAKILRSHGFETVGYSANWGFGTSRWGLGQGFGQYQDYTASLRHNFGLTLVGRQVGGPLSRYNPYYFFVHDRHSASDVDEDIHQWIRRRPDRPFFLFINYMDAHAPYIPPSEPYQSRFGLLPTPLASDMENVPHRDFAKQLSQTDRAKVIDGYDNTLVYLDEQLANLFQSVSDSPASSNTIVIITADHGEAFGEHGTYGHRWDLYREVLRVPLIVFGAGIPAGRRVASLVETRDIFATVLDLAGVQYPRPHGSSLRRFWTPGLNSGVSGSAVSELYRYIDNRLGYLDNGPDAKDSISLMTDEWHYLHDSNGHEELYRWPDDPQEARNLAGTTPEYQGAAAQLHARLCETIVASLSPLLGREYLDALKEPSSSSQQTALGCGLDSILPKQPRPRSEEEELLNTLPYR
jgi:arylsulfatase A-like enzyme